MYIYYVDSDTSQWVDASPDSWDNTIIPDLNDPVAQSGTLDDRYKLKTDPNDPIVGDLYIGGNIGIGTETPAERLHISENLDSDILIERTGVAPSEVRLRNYNDFAILSNNTLGIDLQTGTTPSSKVRVDAAGNVGIGTTNPSEKLDVSGKTATTSLQISGSTNAQFLATDASGNVISTDAPADNQQWARKNNSWAVVEATSSGEGGGGGTTVNYSGAAAWAESGGTSTLNSSLNIDGYTWSSGSPGVYTYTFATPMPSASYAVVATPRNSGDATAIVVSRSSTGFTLNTRIGGTLSNTAHSVVVHATNALPPQGGTGADCWLDCQGSVSNGLVGDNASFNVQSIERLEAGYYKITFTTAMPSADYAVSGSASSGATGARYIGVFDRTTTDFTIIIKDDAGAVKDTRFSLVVHASNAQLPDTITQEELDAALKSPGVSAWGKIDGTSGALTTGLNCTAVRVSTGVYDVTFINSMPGAYAITATPDAATSDGITAISQNILGTGFRLVTVNASGSVADPIGLSFTVFATNAQPPKGGTGADAWATTSSTGALESSFNFASVTKTGTGYYEYTFSTPMPNANYAAVATPVAGGARRSAQVQSRGTGGFVVTTWNLDDTAIDLPHCVVVHATNATLPAPLTQAELLFVDGRYDATGVQKFNAGIQLGAAATDTLDDYEEGTFTPTIEGGTAYTNQDGYYTKVGNIVHFFVRVLASAATGNSNTWKILGLPFTSGGAGVYGGAFRNYGDHLPQATFTDLNFHVPADSTVIRAYDGQTTLYSNNSNVLLTRAIVVQGFYKTDS